MPREGLNARQQRFVDEYLIDLNATQAAIRAGYSKASAGSVGDEILKKPEIAEVIRLRRTERAVEAKIDQQWVLDRLIMVNSKCLDPGDGGRIDSAGATRSAELIGKHLGMFTDRVEQTLKLDLSSLSDEDLDQAERLAARLHKS